MKKIATAILLIALTATAFALPDPEVEFEKAWPELKEFLELNAETAPPVETLMREHVQEVKAALAGGRDMASYRKVRKLREKQESQLEKLLTPDQLIRLKTWREQRRSQVRRLVT